jgi:hypothetical protein
MQAKSAASREWMVLRNGMRKSFCHLIFRTFASCCALLSQVAFAQEFSMGRVKLSFGSPGWIAAEVPDTGVDYSGEVSGTIPSETRIFVNRSDNQDIQAFLIVRVSKGGIGNGYFEYSPNCQDKQAIAAEGNKGFNQSYLQCLLVYPQFTTHSLLKNLTDSEGLILKSAKLKLPDAMHAVYSRYHTANGSYMFVRAYLAPSFVGLRTTGSNDVDPHVAWGQALMDAVKSGAGSMFGRSKIPAVEFDNSSKEKKLVELTPSYFKIM